MISFSDPPTLAVLKEGLGTRLSKTQFLILLFLAENGIICGDHLLRNFRHTWQSYYYRYHQFIVAEAQPPYIDLRNHNCTNDRRCDGIM